MQLKLLKYTKIKWARLFILFSVDKYYYRGQKRRPNKHEK